ncbi:MAG TPA: tail fiber protein [Thermomicrobiales bacterium]|nr:tail fiber protein [Thermomicrobiales bacterium]
MGGGGGAPTRLGLGSAGAVLQSDGMDAVWGAAPSGGGEGAALPTGSIVAYAAATPPSGWLLCDGSAVERTAFAALFAAIGTNYGVGDGSTTFNLPNLKGRLPVGRDAGQSEFDVLGESGGAKSVTLTAAQSGSPAHGHGVGSLATAAAGSHSHTFGVKTNASGGGGASVLENVDSDATTFTTAATGSHTHGLSGSVANNAAAGAVQAHDNLPPYLTLNFLIKT